jgi:hypothetical protein
MKIKIYIENEDGKTIKEFVCITDSIPRALQMYEDEVGEFEYLKYSIIE